MRSWSLEMEMQKESPRIPRVMKRYFSFVTVETLPHTLPLFLPSSLPACLRLSLLIPSSLPSSLPATLSLSLSLSLSPPPPPPTTHSLWSVKGSTTEGVTAFDFFFFQLSNMMHRKIQRQNLQPPGTTRREKEAVTTTARTTRTRFLTKKFALAR